jgi:formylglycine-generating enzyme required for sulfatase activity
MQRLLTVFALLGLIPCASAQSPKIETALTNSLEMPFVRVASINALVCRFETRVKDYQAFVTANALEWKKPDFPQAPDHPAMNVSMQDAEAFCEWLGKKEGRKYRLPTDQEWSLLAGLKEKPDVFPTQQPAKHRTLSLGHTPAGQGCRQFL